ncbi:gamma-mobile-trio recombinase GmtY [Rhodoferax koreense]|uniref:gamma-mobile-trio recombinase GmtY n=1 Tax=Rhodoferax koreensis TaxID=1842727 RepID=UPI0009FAA321|nr:gamma-mobile-trio recombinase GmtY [Rhodoferax koreense]
MNHVRRYCNLITDNTGVTTNALVILTDNGPIIPLLRFVEENLYRSASWLIKLHQAVSLLIDYISSNQNIFSSADKLFGGFVKRLYSGTVGADGKDPSELYWTGKNSTLVRQLVGPLSEFSDWMVKEGYSQSPINPWRPANHVEEILAWASWQHANRNAFLGHTWNKNVAAIEMSQARNVLLKREPAIDHAATKRFPGDSIGKLLFNGFLVPRKNSSDGLGGLNLRDILITMLMHYGGLRVSEPFHIYVHDIRPDVINPQMANVRVFHPSEGKAPLDWKDAIGKPINTNRANYLKGKYGLLPRTDYKDTSQMYAGWKNNLLTDSTKSMHVHWFPTWAGELFLKIWSLYLIRRAQFNDHPFAFVTLSGKPYALDSFQSAHKAAVKRIGLSYSKFEGTTPHGHRHDFGRRLAEAKVNELVIKKALHHKSMKAQVVYTEPDINQISKIFEEITSENSDLNITPASNPVDFGFPQLSLSDYFKKHFD